MVARRSRVQAWLVAAGLLIAGCAQTAPQNTHPLAAAAPPPVLAEKLRLAPGDEIGVDFFYHPELNQDLLVRPDGYISLPHAGEILAAGMQPDALSAVIQRDFADVLKQPDATVIVKSLASRKVYVGGQVSTPSVVKLLPGMSVSQAIVAAGGFLKTGREKTVLLLRYRPQGKPLVATIDVKAVLDGTGVDPLLQPYDVIYVPRTLVANADLFVEQYLNDIIPRSVSFPFNYFLAGGLLVAP